MSKHKSNAKRKKRGSAEAWLRMALALAGLAMAAQRYRDEQARRQWLWSGAGEQAKPGMALVTGASSGIGKNFALALASHGHDLILVARRAERLTAVAQELNQQYGIKAEVLPADLAAAVDLERVAARIEQLDNLELLINNAGFGIVMPFAESDVHRQIDMIELHAIASIRLMRAALPGMIARRHGGIINVSSTAAYFPIASTANYAASKAYLNVFTEALHNELQGTGVRVQALCPGFTYTEFHDQSDNLRREEIPAFMWMPAERVVRESLEALEKDRVVYVPGMLNKVVAAIGRSGLASGLTGMIRR